jgi:hypothetical protein
MIHIVQIIGILAVAAFLILVTIGEDLAIAFLRIRDSFHPLDRELRQITQNARRIHR